MYKGVKRLRRYARGMAFRPPNPTPGSSATKMSTSKSPQRARTSTRNRQARIERAVPFATPFASTPQLRAGRSRPAAAAGAAGRDEPIRSLTFRQMPPGGEAFN